jgi:hypothetical protein
MNLTEAQMRQALSHLAKELRVPIQLIIGGGGAMMLAYHFALATSDIDGIPKGIELHELDKLVKKVAEDLKIPKDWLNPYFSTFTHVLPGDYGQRLVSVFAEANLEVLAISRDDLLIMKCFAGRQKDVSHSKALIKAGARVAFAEKHIETLRAKGIPGSDKALDFLDDVQEQMG